MKDTRICAFCTERQLSVCHFTQFCILTKIDIETNTPFVYNVFIVVLSTICKHRRE